MKRLRSITLLVALAAAAQAGAAVAAQPLPLPAGWSHAQVNVVGPNGSPHTFIYDRGRVVAVTSSSLTLHEPDGSIVTIQVAPAAVVRVNGRLANLAAVQPGFKVQTLGVDGRPARRVQAVAAPVVARSNVARLRAVRRR